MLVAEACSVRQSMRAHVGAASANDITRSPADHRVFGPEAHLVRIRVLKISVKTMVCTARIWTIDVVSSSLNCEEDAIVLHGHKPSVGGSIRAANRVKVGNVEGALLIRINGLTRKEGMARAPRGTHGVRKLRVSRMPPPMLHGLPSGRNSTPKLVAIPTSSPFSSLTLSALDSLKFGGPYTRPVAVYFPRSATGIVRDVRRTVCHDDSGVKGEI